MFYSFNDALGENFNWFWKAWFFDFGYPDLALETKDDQLMVKRVGAGSLPLPVKLIVENRDGSTSIITKSMKVWKNGEKEIRVELENKNNIKSIRIDPVSIPDIDKSNNRLQLKN
jgi:aminopeptidase N